MTEAQPVMISPKISTLAVNSSSPLDSSPPFLCYSPGYFDTPSSTTSSLPASLCTTSTSLPGSPGSFVTTYSDNGKVIHRQPSRMRRKPAPRLTLEEELALLDDESRRVAEGVAPAVIAGFALLPAIALLAKSSANAPTASAHQASDAPPRALYSVMPDIPSAIMQSSPTKAGLPANIPKIIATVAKNDTEPDREGSDSPIPPDSPSVCEVAIEWYNSPVLEKENTKRFRNPTDAAQDCGSPSSKNGASASCRSSLAHSEFSEGDQLEVLSMQQSEHDSEDGDEEKRGSIMTDTFGPAQHIRECKTGKCDFTAGESDDGDSDDEDNDDSDGDSSRDKDYIGAIPIPISPSAENLENEAMDTFGDSVRLSQYRWLPKKFGEHKDGRKYTVQSFSTTTTQIYPRSRSPTFDTETGSFVTAAEALSSPSFSNGEGGFLDFQTSRAANVARLPKQFISTSPSLRSIISDSGVSNAATFTASDDISNEGYSIFDTPTRCASEPSQQRGSRFGVNSPAGNGRPSTIPRTVLPGRKISLGGSSPGRPSYSAATMRWDRVESEQREWKNGVRRPYLKSNPSFIDEFPPPPASYQMNAGKLPQTPKNKKRILRPSTAPELGIGYTPPSCTSPVGSTPNRRRAFSLVMRELLALHEANIQARHEAAHAKAQKKADVKQALKLYTYKRPETEDLELAADCVVYSSTGSEVRFGDLYEGARTIVCFIRHYWCPSCQDYLASIMRIEPAQLRALNLQLIIIGCGNWKMIEGYRKALGGCEFPIYSDPSREVYKHFGITMSTMAAGPKPAYTKHGLTANTLISLKRNLAMPLKNPGDLGGLGGEFVVGPGTTECAYAHRMKTTRDHAELVDILKAIGMTAPRELQVQAVPVRRARSAEEIRIDQVQRRAESVRRKRAKAYKPGRIVVTIAENGHVKESSTQTL